MSVRISKLSVLCCSAMHVPALTRFPLLDQLAGWQILPVYSALSKSGNRCQQAGSNWLSTELLCSARLKDS